MQLNALDANARAHLTPQFFQVGVAQHLPLLVKESPPPDDRAGLLHGLAHAESPKRSDPIGSKIDACSNRGPPLAAFNQLCGEALTVQGRRQGKPSNSSAGDQNPFDVRHRRPPLWCAQTACLNWAKRIQPDDENENQGGAVLEFESARSRTQKILSIPEAMLIAISIPPSLAFASAHTRGNSGWRHRGKALFGYLFGGLRVLTSCQTTMLRDSGFGSLRTTDTPTQRVPSDKGHDEDDDMLISLERPSPVHARLPKRQPALANGIPVY